MIQAQGTGSHGRLDESIDFVRYPVDTATDPDGLGHQRLEVAAFRVDHFVDARPATGDFLGQLLDRQQKDQRLLFLSVSEADPVGRRTVGFA